MTISSMQTHTPRVKRLPTAAEIRLKLRAQKKRKDQEEKEERLLARWLLFVKGRGQSKNLKMKDVLFIRMVIHKAFDRYMSDLVLGTKLRLRPDKHHAFALSRWTPSRPPSFMSYRKIWYGSAKRNYLYWDVPRLMKMRWEALKDGGTNTQMQECGGRYMQELQRQISERERGDVGVPVPDLPVHSSRIEGLGGGQKQIRARRKKEAGSHRDAASVGA